MKMKKVLFELVIDCSVGYDHNEDVALMEVGTFLKALQVSDVLKKRQRVAYNNDEKVNEAYKEIVSLLRSESGERIEFVGEVIGIQAFYQDEKGIRVQMSLNDNSGVSGYARIDNEEYENEYKKMLGEAKGLATKILRL